jgi:triacylglycerol lipase
MRRAISVMALCFLMAGLIPAGAMAATAVMLQGYLEDGHDWRASGVSRPLLDAGWQDGGQLLLVAQGVASDLPRPVAENRFYTVVLPSEAPLTLQVTLLERYMAEVTGRHGEEDLYLIGHSAGGVLARLFMVRNPASGVDGLITIATPHTGSVLAEWGNAIGNSPLSWLTPWLGLSTINRSQALYHELNRPYPGTLLNWLNQQPHPRAHYVSVIRESGLPFVSGDGVVEGWSQDMNQVPALRGRAKVVMSSGGHYLQIGDGVVIADLLTPAAASAAGN